MIPADLFRNGQRNVVPNRRLTRPTHILNNGSCGVVVKYDNIPIRIEPAMEIAPRSRPISWLTSALKDFRKFPEGAQTICLTALTIAAEGGKTDIAKPLHGLGSGVFEVALPFRGDAYRVVYAVQLADAVWVVHAFQKKSTQGIKTPKRELDLVRDRLKRLKEIL
jgi:phage-related protein